MHPVSVVVSVGFSFCFAGMRGAARRETCRSPTNTGDFPCSAYWCAALLDAVVTINSAASYQLDHAPSIPILPFNKNGRWVPGHWQLSVAWGVRALKNYDDTSAALYKKERGRWQLVRR